MTKFTYIMMMQTLLIDAAELGGNNCETVYFTNIHLEKESEVVLADLLSPFLTIVRMFF